MSVGRNSYAKAIGNSLFRVVEYNFRDLISVRTIAAVGRGMNHDQPMCDIPTLVELNKGIQVFWLQTWHQQIAAILCRHFCDVAHLNHSGYIEPRRNHLRRRVNHRYLGDGRLIEASKTRQQTVHIHAASIARQQNIFGIAASLQPLDLSSAGKVDQQDVITQRVGNIEHASAAIRR